MTDEDIGINSEVDFSIDVAAQDFFSLLSTGPLSAELNLINQFDRETTATYAFTIFVLDRGLPHLVGHADVVITVEVSGT